MGSIANLLSFLNTKYLHWFIGEYNQKEVDDDCWYQLEEHEIDVIIDSAFRQRTTRVPQDIVKGNPAIDNFVACQKYFFPADFDVCFRYAEVDDVRCVPKNQQRNILAYLKIKSFTRL